MNDRNLERSLKALANGRRLSILRILKKRGEATVGSISDGIRLSFRSTSKHLSVLSAVDIVEHEQRSSEVFYRIQNNVARPVRTLLSFL